MDIENIKQEILSQTARINYTELERHFAAGKLIYVSDELDLIEVGVNLIQDNKAQFENWVAKNLIYPVTDAQAQHWTLQHSALWTSVINPWILVQERTDKGA